MTAASSRPYLRLYTSQLDAGYRVKSHYVSFHAVEGSLGLVADSPAAEDRGTGRAFRVVPSFVGMTLDSIQPGE